MADETPTLTTAVGHADWGDNRFRGHSIADDLAGTTDIWSLLSLAVGHRRLDARECAILDDLAVCATAADPRIWPLKVIRLGSAWGDETIGLCVGVLTSSSAVHGPPLVRHAARLLIEVHAAFGEHGEDLELVVLRRLADGGMRLPGFGVAVRDRDERVETFRRAMARRGVEPGTYSSLLASMEAITRARRGLLVNIGGMFAATLLDLGFTPQQAPAMVQACVFASFLANAHEGAAQAPAVLRRLPAAAIRYVGAPPRKSPRSR